ncbi:hypothetical protein C0993_009577 [Termitomyces sp. T159_Od127]|nr:hypothetical protein C0993_009577 [Termitomyces sp. T159_Od127]
MPKTDQPFSSDDDLEPQSQAPLTQSNDAAFADMMTMLHAFAALANQSPGLMSSFAEGMQGVQANPPPSFPAFLLTDQSLAGKSLPALFPAIETSLLLDIACHKFHPMDLCKLNPALKFRHADWDHMDSNSLWIIGTKDYPVLHNLLIPLSTYFSILQAFVALLGDAHATFVIEHGTARYFSHLMTLKQKYKSSAVLQYHIHFHLN